jgi:hypothetical protein
VGAWETQAELKALLTCVLMSFESNREENAFVDQVPQLGILTVTADHASDPRFTTILWEIACFGEAAISRSLRHSRDQYRDRARSFCERIPRRTKFGHRILQHN